MSCPVHAGDGGAGVWLPGDGEDCPRQRATGPSADRDSFRSDDPEGLIVTLGLVVPGLILTDNGLTRYLTSRYAAYSFEHPGP